MLNKQKLKTLFENGDIRKHNRFRWFSATILNSEIQDRIINPWLINQDDTNTCGPSAIMYIFAKKFPLYYSNFILNLHRKGYAEFNNYKINIGSDKDLKRISETNPITAQYFPKKMVYSDWIPNTCVTDQENGIFDFVGDNKEDFSSITLPSRLKKLATDLLGFTELEDYITLLFNKTVRSTLDNINKLIDIKNQGYEVFTLISINMLYNKATNSLTTIAEH